MENCADHADTKERHAHVMDLFFVTVNHRLRRVERVDRLSFVDSQAVAVVGDERAARERMESPGLAAVGAVLVSALPLFSRLSGDLLNRFVADVEEQLVAVLQFNDDALVHHVDACDRAGLVHVNVGLLVR